jgi:heme A synthase
MKELYFYVLFAAIFAAQTGLIMGGVLDPESSYSARNILFSVFVAAVVIYMGWNFSESGIKKVAVKGAIVAFVGVTVIACASIIGYTIGKPILGEYLPSAAYMVLPLLYILLLSAILYALLAVLGTWAAQRFKSSQIKKKEADSAKK